MHKAPFSSAFRSLGVLSTLIFLCNPHVSQGCYADGTVTANGFEGSSSTSPLPSSQSIQPAIIRLRCDKTYTVTSVIGYWYGTRQSVDRLGVSRVVQQRYANNVYGSPVSVNIPSADGLSQNGLPAPGVSNATRTFGAYTPVNNYGVEFIYLNMVDSYGNFWLPEVTHNPIITNSNPGYAVMVYVYPKTDPASFYYNKLALTGKTIPWSASTIEVKMSNLYPGGSTWVQLYQGTPQNPLSGVTTIQSTQASSKTNDVDSRDFNIDLSTVIKTTGVYTVEAFQRTAAYGDERLGTATSFTVTTSTFSVNTALGLLK